MRIVLSAAVLLSLSAPAGAQTRFREADAAAGLRTAFGAALVLDGGTLYAGRPGELDFFPSPPAHAGSIHVFTSDGDSWSERTTVSAEGSVLGDGFGSALAVAGPVMAVGAPKTEGNRGAVYIFERAGDAWRQTARLVPDGAQENDRFGIAVAVAGDQVLVGMPGERNGSGAVLVYRKSGETWSRTGVLAPGDVAQGDAFGSAIAASETRVAIGAPGPLPWVSLFGGQQPRAGKAWVFGRTADGGWRSEGLLSGGEGSLVFGAATAIAGDAVLVGAPFAGQGMGAVVAFGRSPEGAWTETGRVTADAPGTGFGIALQPAGTDLFVGTPLAGGAGGFRVFRQGTDGSWSAVQTVGLSAPFGFGGSAIAAEPEVAVVGVPGADFFQGSGLVYTRGGDGQWAAGDTLFTERAGLDPITGRERPCAQGDTGPFACSEVDLVAFLPVSAVGGGRGGIVNDLWGWTDPETEREYAIVGRADATTFIDVTDPANPVYLGELPIHEGATPNVWRDIKVYANHAFIVADGTGPHGVQVFDLTQLRGLSGPPRTFAETAHYDRIASAHNIVINENTGFAYVVGASMGGETCGGGLHMIDIREPTNPTFAGCFADTSTGNARTGYSHDAQCIRYHGPDEQYADREICFGANETALSISDVTDKENPLAVSVATYPNSAYLHQGWVSDDHRYLFMNDEGDELSGQAPRTRTLVWDIADLDDPILVKEHLGETEASDHNLYVKGNYLYESNYVSGLRVLDISDPTNPVEVGYFDTVPWGEDVPGFAGSWSNYPYFSDDIVVVTSMFEGVFILRYRPPRVIS